MQLMIGPTYRERTASLFFALILCLAAAVRAQSPIDEGSVPCPVEGYWVGWLETPSQHVRLVLQMKGMSKATSDAAQGRIQGTITSPDQAPIAIPFANCSLDDDGEMEFNVNPQRDPRSNYSFRGKHEGDRITGWFEQASARLPLAFQRVDKLPDEGLERLGADSAWKGEIDIAIQKIAVRFRVYSQPPFGDPDQPRILFDSLTEKVNGFPVRFGTAGKELLELTIAGLPGNAKYLVTLDPTSDRIRGRFIQSLLPLSLELQRVEELRQLPLSTDAWVTALQRRAASPKPMDQEPQPLSVDTQSSIDASLPAGVREESFSVERVDYAKAKVKQAGRWVHPAFRIGGTITRPDHATATAQVPAVVMVSGSGPQDRNETIGSHQPFRVLAHWLAKHGIASLRYDDRGVGASTGDFLNSTTADFAEDAQAVWEYAKSLEGVDPLRIGILGHSEGGIIGPLIAANQPEVAFLILLAPPAFSGHEILASQIDRIAEVQGIDADTRVATAELQRRLQQLAVESDAGQEKTLSLVRQAVFDRWEALKKMSAETAGESEEARRERVIETITTQFKGLQSPWMRHFLIFDPSSAWLTMRAPTLAIWGDKDVQVLASPNRERLRDIASRNTRLRGDLVILPDINHMMQRAETGLPEEYDRIVDSIDDTVLFTIKEWLQQRNLIP